MQVFRMTDHTHDDVGLGGGGNGSFVAVFIRLAIFAFTHAVNIRLMDRVDFVVVALFLIEDTLIEQKISLALFKQDMARQGSSEFVYLGESNRA